MWLVLGKNGQLGKAFTGQLGKKTLSAGRAEIDLASPDFISQLECFTHNQPIAAVINAAAYTQVDKAEGEGRAEAFRVNAEAVGELAGWCKERNLPLVHFSTDYVFDGSGETPRREDNPTAPLNAYGESKLAGEQAIIKTGGDYLIFRTSWVYDAFGKNFLTTMLRLFPEREELNIVSDQMGAPTYAPHLAAAAITALEKSIQSPDFPKGIYHLCNGGQTSWHGFASAIFTLAQKQNSLHSFACKTIRPIPSSAYPTPAKRPLNSRLDCRKAANVWGVTMPSWEEGLYACIDERYGSEKLPAARP